LRILLLTQLDLGTVIPKQQSKYFGLVFVQPHLRQAGGVDSEASSEGGNSPEVDFPGRLFEHAQVFGGDSDVPGDLVLGFTDTFPSPANDLADRQTQIRKLRHHFLTSGE
jgi:hypothetical protein